MAKATIKVEFDGGSTVKVTEVSVMPIMGGIQGVPLAQVAFQSLCGALGLQPMSAEQVLAEERERTEGEAEAERVRLAAEKKDAEQAAEHTTPPPALRKTDTKEK